MSALAYLHEHGLEAESLPGDRIAVWPGEAITPSLESWIAEHKSEIVSELRKSAAPAEKKNQSPDAILLRVAERLHASPTSLRAMLTDDDMQDIADGMNSSADMLDFFRLAQENGELLTDQRQPVAPEPAAKVSDHRPDHLEQMKAWEPFHVAMINHLMICQLCRAPRNRYCPEGQQLREDYHAAYERSESIPSLLNLA